MHAQIGTNQWIWTHPAYLKWFEGESSILWIQGKPFSGKSTLAKTIQKTFFSKFASESNEALFRRPRVQDSIIADFFYSTRGGQRETSHKLMLQSLLYQILEQGSHLFEVFQEPFRRMKHKSESTDGIEWSHDALRSVFLSLAHDKDHESKNPRCKIYILLDAIDESEDEEKERILYLLRDLCLGRGKIKVIIVSRPMTKEGILGKFHRIELQRENQVDIEKVVDAGLRSISDMWGELNERQPGEVKRYLLNNARGVILWVVRIINYIEALVSEGSTMKEINEALKGLPNDLESGYKRIIRNLPPDNIEIARPMLIWASFAKRHLTLEEFQDAIDISQSQISDLEKGWPSFRQRILSTCGGLVEIVAPDLKGSIESSSMIRVRPTDSVQLLHQTVKDFLMRPDHDRKPFHLDHTNSNLSIATASLRYLKLSLPMEGLKDKPFKEWGPRDYKEFTNYLPGRPLLEYVLTFLPTHIRHSETGDIGSDLSEYLRQLRSQPDSHAWAFLEGWCRQNALFPNPPAATDTSVTSFIEVCLITASQARQTSVVKSILAAAADFKLSRAAALDLEDVIRLLMEKGGVSKNDKLMALHQAIEDGHKAAVRVLLEKGFDFNAEANGQTARKLAYDRLTKAIKERNKTVEERQKAIGRLLKDAEFALLRLADKPITGSDAIDCKFHATIGDFSSSEGEGHADWVTPTVDKVMVGTGIMDGVSQGDDRNGHTFRWLHLPANNVSHIKFRREESS
jgi:hypothetical protein